MCPLGDYETVFMPCSVFCLSLLDPSSESTVSPPLGTHLLLLDIETMHAPPPDSHIGVEACNLLKNYSNALPFLPFLPMVLVCL